MPQHLEHEAFQTYEQLKNAYWMELRQVERYWKTQLELILALKEGVTSSILAVLVVKMEQAEGVFVVDVKGAIFLWT